MEDKKRIGLIVAIYLIAIILIGILLKVSSFTIRAGDDYQMINVMNGHYANAWDYFCRCIKYTVESWRNWQGTYSVMFISANVIKFDFTSYENHRFLIVASNALLFLSVLLFVRTVTKNIGSEIIRGIIFLVAICSLVTFNPYSEIYYWYTGTVAYIYPLMAVLIGLALVISLEGKGQVLRIILALFCGLIGMGGILVHVALGCSVLLCIVAYRMIKCKSFLIKEGIVLILWIVFGLVNALAPGNFVRNATATSEGLNLYKALLNSVYMTDCRFQTLFNTGFVVLLVVLFACGYYALDSVKIDKTYVICSALAIVIPFIVTFPVMLGYGRRNMPERCAFIVDVSIILVIFNLAFVLGNIFAQYYAIKSMHIIILSIGLMISVVDGYGISNTQTIEMLTGLDEHTYSDYYDACIDFYNILEEAEDGADVEIANERFPQPISNFYNLEVLDYPDYWINAHMANYYDLNSLVVLPE